MRYQIPDIPNRRDARLIMHVFRNFITLTEVVRDLYFADLSQDTVRKVLNRLVANRFFSKHELFGNKSYFRLGEASTSRWGFPVSRTHKLGAQRLPYELGALAYNCLDQRPRKRLLRHELKRRLPWFPDSLMQWSYLWERGRLGSLRVEPRARPSIVIHKLANQLYRYSDVIEFRELIEQQRFFFVCITASKEQETALQNEAAEQSLPVELRTANYPELIRFI